MAKVYKVFLLWVFLCLGLGVFPSAALANSLSITNVSLEDRNQTDNTVVVEFDISWENSWRTDESWDAAWVFMKACQGAACSSAWIGVHAMLNTAGTDPSDTSTGSNEDLTIVVPSDKVGAFIYRASNGTGTTTATNVRLTVDYATSPMTAGDTDQIQIRVYGIEMVYIPNGDFWIGDGNETSESAYAFHDSNNSAVQITNSLTNNIWVDTNANDDIQLDTTGYGIGIDGDGGIDTDDNGAVNNASFPTGYKAFYIMKYELSQGQYRDFLNTLTRVQQNTRTGTDLSVGVTSVTNRYVMSGGSTPSYRNYIRCPATIHTSNPVVVYADADGDGTGNESNDGEWIAMNYLSWMDLAAYADWAGLRPITELEFERAARGPTAPVYGEYAWGTTYIIQVTGISNAGQASEVATTTGGGLSTYGSGVSGPLRVGFAATSSTTRITGSVGYYGIMELSGNTEE
ncbi:MAG TPA: SUMF1/EgtB/PvdO family nonheme iron enzyme, partial [Candidatus Omnitrophota bacterium]|nr:SUMF1/EgtB/PvdO family nonheme iron enzyme [Candidatus Omnitrophota bacterium]